MQHFLKPLCPHCGERVFLLSEPWQAQKGQRSRTCPFCKGNVEPKFKAGTYAVWFVALLGLGVVASNLFGSHGFSLLLVAAFIVPLLPSIYLAHAA